MSERPPGNSFKARRTFKLGARRYAYYSLKAAEKNGLDGISRLPFSLKVLLENLLRHEDGTTVKPRDVKALKSWLRRRRNPREIAFHPARVLMQDLTGVPAVADLASMRDGMAALGSAPEKINPQVPVDLVIDHSVMVDHFAAAGAFRRNVELEFERNGERYAFLRWGAAAFDNFRVVPPGTGICHQVNLEHLGRTVWTHKRSGGRDAQWLAYPDTLVGTDSHTTMINALAVLGWGVGGIEAEAAMLGQPISMLLPEVVGFRLQGRTPEGVTATDVVLTVTQMLRAHGVVGKFVEFHGPGLNAMALEDRATIANMAPEYGATCGFFPVDAHTLTYLKATGRTPSQVALVEKYARLQGMWRTSRTPDPVFTETLHLDLGEVRPSLAGPRRPQDRVALDDMPATFAAAMETTFKTPHPGARHAMAGRKDSLGHGDVVIAAITSCTNTSNPGVMLGAGLLARNAVRLGLKVKPWVKTSLAPGSQVVSDYLKKAGLQKDLNALGFNLVGYGCTTCIGNSGPLPPEISSCIRKHDLVAAAVLSGNRNFESRISPDVRANYLASPMLVVAYALAGSVRTDLGREPLGADKTGAPVMLADIWPQDSEITAVMRRCMAPAMFRNRYADVFRGSAPWRKIKAGGTVTYPWEKSSTYVRQPPFLQGMAMTPPGVADVEGARILGLFGDSVTTDHISPAGVMDPAGPAAAYLTDRGVARRDFNSYGSRRGNHEVMMRGTFANIRIRNHMAPGTEGGVTVLHPEGRQMSIYDAAQVYASQGVPLVVCAGREYGTGSSRDWAAKGTLLLGVRAVIARSFERIHRSNLIGMGVAPLQFDEGASWDSLGLDGSEMVSIKGLGRGLKPRAKVTAEVTGGGRTRRITLLCRIDTATELDYYAHGGILPFVLRRLAA